MKPLLFLLLLPAAHAVAVHGLALGQPAHYPAGFRSFDYVNPDAPKGGTFTMPAAGSFDTLNPLNPPEVAACPESAGTQS